MKNLLLAALCAPLFAPHATSDELVAQRPPDGSKTFVELGIKEAIKRSYGLSARDLPPLADAVPAGDVAWHPSYEDALAAAEQSGKPVLLFQMLGRLDEGFC